MTRLGITGGIGSGKSTVARVFEILGVPVFYADIVAKQAYSDQGIRQQIIDRWGEHLLTPSGVQVEFMRKKIFQSEENRTFINGLVHPWVQERYNEWKALTRKHPYTLKEAALLIESGGYKDCDKIILITAPMDRRIKRIALRDGLTPQDIEKRILAQWSDEEKRKYADYVWANDNAFPLLDHILKLDNLLRA
jgi:dephospho-CoA kinase